MIHEGDVMPAYYGETANSCRLEECLLKASDMIGWKEKGMRTVMPDGKIRARGVAWQCRDLPFPTVTSVLSR